jgi:hypothetical protein
VKDKYAMMFDGKEWNLTMKEDLINKIYDDKKNYIEENLDDFVGSLPVSRKKALVRWLETDEEDDRMRINYYLTQPIHPNVRPNKYSAAWKNRDSLGYKNGSIYNSFHANI